MQNFDKASFLSDQPEHDRLFLWRFLESQMFATLIDNKILSIWGEVDNNLLIFDNRIKHLKQRYGGENLMRSLCYEPCVSAHDTQQLIDRRLSNPDFESPLPREIMNHKTTVLRQFPLLDKEVLNKTPVVNKGSIPRASALKKGLTFSRPPTGSKDNSSKSVNNQDMSPALIAQANWTFVAKLLKVSQLVRNNINLLYERFLYKHNLFIYSFCLNVSYLLILSNFRIVNFEQNVCYWLNLEQKVLHYPAIML